MNNTQFTAEIYSRIPKIECKGLCDASCGPILLTNFEYKRIVAQAGAPKITGTDCPWLSEGRCKVYSVRPLICRLWGVTEGMPCTFGCRPDSVLSDEDAHEMIDAMNSRFGVSKEAEGNVLKMVRTLVHLRRGI